MKTGAARIEDYAFISDRQSGALISRDGCVDWLCLPRFDSGACFAALLGEKENGSWSFIPQAEIKRRERRYRGDTLILETDLHTEDGAVRFIDFMPPRGTNPDIIRIVEGLRGKVEIRMELVIRFDYGSVVPWVRRCHGGLEAIAGPDALILHTPVETHGEELKTVAEFAVAKGERIPFVLTWFASHELPPKEVNAEHALKQTEDYWNRWSKRYTGRGPWRDAVMRSLLTLKGLTYAPTGGMVAALTTSLPEEIGGVRNWDYRYCWLRDATFTLFSLLGAGYKEEAKAWREWLLRAIAGSASQLQIMYGVLGERRLIETELPWLSGYEGSQPVRVGNAAAKQFQLDVYGEVVDAMYHAQRAGLDVSEADWRMQVALLNFLETKWEEPDEGIWEVRGKPQQFTHSKVMAWVAFDRAVKLVEHFDRAGNDHLATWKKLRGEIHREVCERGYHPDKKSFTQTYGSEAMDASLLMIPLVGFLPPNDERVKNTIQAVERELLEDGLVMRYRPTECEIDGLAGSEGVFLPCSFWLADCLHLIGRAQDARQLFERLLALRNDVGLLSEEYDPKIKRQLGNFPQAFTHVGLVNTAQVLAGEPGAAVYERKDA
ncbi:MAG: glycoside hydrolase family 15 protein [Verrucomicrobiota bacterium]|nr:glycoside hydrolase family 15 protein [Verrucomicrobiota bacterium]